MTVKEMHYDVKQKLNKIDSQQYRNLQVPEIDFKLNEAQELFIKIVAEPRTANQFGFETSQRTIDDIRALVINQNDTNALTTTVFDSSSFTVTLPTNYLFYVSSYILASKGNCKDIKLTSRLIQHDDTILNSKLYNSSFEWRFANMRFFQDKIRIFTDNTFNIDKLCLNYIKKPAYIHNAQDYPGGQYKHLGTGLMLTGTQDCELSEHTHREIVDLAVQIISGDLDLSNYSVKQNKNNINNN